MKWLMAFLIVAFLVNSTFADVGPGPAPPSLRVVLYKAGERFTGDATANYLCSAAKERGPAAGAVQPGDKPLSCSGGVCTIDSWYYKFNPCFASTGRIEVKTSNGAAVSNEFTMESGRDYAYDMDVASGALTGKGGGDSQCAGAAGILAFCALFAFARA
jgi:hypothetical protein